MRASIFIAFFLVTSFLQAQVSVYIEDETQSGFKLVVDSFVQNTYVHKKLIIDKLNTTPHHFLFAMKDTAPTFSRSLHLRQSGQYKYVLMRNFKGKLQLRYRGKQDSYPDGTTRMKLQKVLPYEPVPKPEVPKPSMPEDTTVVTRKEQKKAKDTVAAMFDFDVPESMQKLKDSLNKNLKPGKDTLNLEASAPKIPEKTADTGTKKTEEKPASFEQQLQNLLNISFEFEKLTYARQNLLKKLKNSGQVAQVLKTFKYDQTRLQFLEKLKAKKPSLLTPVQSLLPTFEFEISKNKVKQMLGK